jgi:hypothetical protein
MSREKSKKKANNRPPKYNNSLPLKREKPVVGKSDKIPSNWWRKQLILFGILVAVQKESHGKGE